MPIRPIDIQTLLMQLSQVGRDQAVEKDGVALQSSIQGAAAQRRQVESKEAVRKSEELKDGASPVSERSGKGQAERRHGEGEKSEEGGEPPPEEEVVRDPELGTRIDLSG
jgi:hypothetical protein